MLDKTYDPKEIEARLYPEWEKSGAFRAHPESPKPPYCIVIPPPNVTGSLHMGHALDNTLQDVLIRWRRMKGDDVLWQPGTDHAGIATQMVVVRNLEQEGIGLAVEGADKGDGNKKLLNREEFLAKVWEWKAYSGGTITGQLRRLGASCDWSRERFTMDEGLSRAVLKVFVDLYKAGLIYKDNRLVNWDPKMLTAISDLEVELREVRGSLWYFRYPDRGQRRAHRRGDDAARDHAGRHRRRGASRRSQVEAPDRQARDPAAGRPAHPDRGRRILRSGEGLGRGQDHAGARLQRLRGRPPPQARGHQHLRQVRAAERQGAGEVPRPRPLRGAQEDRGRHGGAGPASRRSSRTPTPCPTAIAAACRSSRS